MIKLKKTHRFFHVKYRMHRLILINILSYIHIFYLYYALPYMLTSINYGTTLFRIFIIGDVLHYIFLGITSFEMTKGLNKQFQSISNIGLIDWLIRLFAYILVYQSLRFDHLINRRVFLIILITFMLISLFLEIKMLKKMKKNKTCHSPKQMNFSAKDIHNLSNMKKAVNIGLFSLVTTYPISIGLLISMSTHSTLRTVIQLIVSILFFLMFIKNECIKYKTFFHNESYRRSLPIFNNTVAIMGFVTIFILEIGSFQSDYLKDSMHIIPILFVLPSYYSTYQMNVKMAKIKKFKREMYN